MRKILSICVILAIFLSKSLAAPAEPPYGISWKTTLDEIADNPRYEIIESQEDRIWFHDSHDSLNKEVAVQKPTFGVGLIVAYNKCIYSTGDCEKKYSATKSWLNDRYGSPAPDQMGSTFLTFEDLFPGRVSPAIKSMPQIFWQQHRTMVALGVLEDVDASDELIIFELYLPAPPTTGEVIGGAVRFWQENAPPVEDTAPQSGDQ